MACHDRGNSPASLVLAARRAGVADDRVLAAIRATPRAAFVPAGYAAEAYSDQPLPIPHGQVTTQPSLSAVMIAGLGLRGGEQVLEIGTGYGYQTALVPRLAAHVVSMRSGPTSPRRPAAACEPSASATRWSSPVTGPRDTRPAHPTTRCSSPPRSRRYRAAGQPATGRRAARPAGRARRAGTSHALRTAARRTGTAEAPDVGQLRPAARPVRLPRMPNMIADLAPAPGRSAGGARTPSPASAAGIVPGQDDVRQRVSEDRTNRLS